jgi:uncharacterized protein (TIGR02001 family)
MKTITKLIGAAATSLALASAVTPASADELGYSITFGGTSDYVFRGLSNSNRDPVLQGSFDLTYGIWYAGIWGSGTDYPNFGPVGAGGEIGAFEVDYYLGVKPVWGPVTFDFAVLYYTFPDQSGPANDGDYLELKAGASMSPLKDLSLAVNNYYSPDAQWKSGETYTLEFMAAYALPQMGIFSPSISGAVGSQWGFDQEYVDFGMAWGDDEYQWWNAGLSLTVDKFTMDFRYWDTALSGAADAQCDFNSSNASSFQCGPTFVFSAKVVLP